MHRRLLYLAILSLCASRGASAQITWIVNGTASEEHLGIALNHWAVDQNLDLIADVVAAGSDNSSVVNSTGLFRVCTTTSSGNCALPLNYLARGLDSQSGALVSGPFQFAGNGIAAVTDPFSALGFDVVAGNTCFGFIATDGNPAPPGTPGIFGASFGHAMTAADLNQDGFDDLIVSDPLNATVFGLDLTTSPPSQLFALTGPVPGNLFGFSLSHCAGTRFYVGDPSPTAGLPGFAHEVVFDPMTGIASIVLSVSWNDARFGVSVADLGDFDGDTIPDFAVGEASIVPGFAPITPKVPFPPTPASAPGHVHVFRINGQIHSILSSPLSVNEPSFGWSICGGDDFDGNHDGLPDLVAGQPSLNLVDSPLGPDLTGIAWNFDLTSGESNGAYTSAVPAAGFGWQVECLCAEETEEERPTERESSGMGAAALGFLPTILAIGAPLADNAGLCRSGQVYGYAGSVQLPINQCCGAVSISKCWSLPPFSLPCAVPTLTISPNTVSGPSTNVSFSLASNPACFPAGLSSPLTFLLAGSLTPFSPTNEFCVSHGGCCVRLPFVADVLTANLFLANPVLFFGSISPVTGSGCYPPSCAPLPISPFLPPGSTIFFGAAIHDGTKWLVGSSGATLQF